ncbi:MAG: EcsC family protein [Candidatus Coproplasma sp.]
MELFKKRKAKTTEYSTCENIDKKPIVTQEDIAKLLDTCYTKSLNGIPNVSESVIELANDYLKKHKTKEAACKAMIKNQIMKCTTSGFLTGFGGFITLPVTLPANVTSVLYVQMRMIACIAYMAGMELNSDSTQTFVYACLAGVAVNEIVKQAGIKFGLKFTTSLVKKIPGKVLTKINQKVGFRFLTKFGTKGIINIGKCIPVVGAVVGGSFDLVETKVIADRAYRWFMEEDFSTTKEKDTESKEDNIEITAKDFEDTENVE